MLREYGDVWAQTTRTPRFESVLLIHNLCPMHEKTFGKWLVFLDRSQNRAGRWLSGQQVEMKHERLNSLYLPLGTRRDHTL